MYDSSTFTAIDIFNIITAIDIFNIIIREKSSQCMSIHITYKKVII